MTRMQFQTAKTMKRQQKNKQTRRPKPMLINCLSTKRAWAMTYQYDYIMFTSQMDEPLNV